MRRWLFLLFIAPCVCAAAALPAVANSSGIHGQVIVRDFPRSRVQPPLRLSFHHHRKFARSLDFLWPFGFIEPVPVFPGGVPDGIAGADALVPAESGAPIALVAPHLPPTRRSAVDERPTVETTPEGVAIVRGPGSRHLER